MKITKYIRAISAAFMLCFIITAISACSFNSSISIGNYVSDVNNNVQQAVSLTRELRKIKEDIDTRSPDDAKQYTELLDKLSELYTNLLKMDAPERYTDIDSELKTNSEKALSKISQLRSLVTASQNTGDDSFYRQDSESVIGEYEEAYNTIVDLSAQAHTRFRND